MATGILFVLVLSITAKPTTTNRTLSLLRRGTAQKFDSEMQQREIAVKQSKADHLVLNPLTVKMPSDAFHDINYLSRLLINRGMVNYYGKKTVVALPFDDGEETPAKLLKRCRDEVGPGGMTLSKENKSEITIPFIKQKVSSQNYYFFYVSSDLL